MPTFINKVDQSNKFWRYTFSPAMKSRLNGAASGWLAKARTKISIRAGSASDTSKRWWLRRLEGYEESSEDGLKAEVKTAQTLGHKNKIRRMEW